MWQSNYIPFFGEMPKYATMILYRHSVVTFRFIFNKLWSKSARNLAMFVTVMSCLSLCITLQNIINNKNHTVHHLCHTTDILPRITAVKTSFYCRMRIQHFHIDVYKWCIGIITCKWHLNGKMTLFIPRQNFMKLKRFLYRRHFQKIFIVFSVFTSIKTVDILLTCVYHRQP